MLQALFSMFMFGLKKHMKVNNDGWTLAGHFMVGYVLNFAVRHECKSAPVGVCLVNGSFGGDVNQVTELVVASNVLMFAPLSF